MAEKKTSGKAQEKTLRPPTTLGDAADLDVLKKAVEALLKLGPAAVTNADETPPGAQTDTDADQLPSVKTNAGPTLSKTDAALVPLKMMSLVLLLASLVLPNVPNKTIAAILGIVTQFFPIFTLPPGTEVKNATVTSRG